MAIAVHVEERAVMHEILDQRRGGVERTQGMLHQGELPHPGPAPATAVLTRLKSASHPFDIPRFFLTRCITGEIFSKAVISVANALAP